METHYYQPGFLFIPFGMYSKNDVMKPKRDFIPAGVEMIKAAADVIEPDKNRVKLADGKILTYDVLVVATGTDDPPGRDAGPRGTGVAAVRSSSSTPSRAPWPWPSISGRGGAAGWS